MKIKLFALILTAVVLFYIAALQKNPEEEKPAGADSPVTSNTGLADSAKPPHAGRQQVPVRPDPGTLGLPGAQADRAEVSIDGELVSEINQRWEEFNLGTVLSPMEPGILIGRLAKTEWGSYQEAYDALARFFDNPEQYPRIVSYFLWHCPKNKSLRYTTKPGISSEKYFDDAHMKHCEEYDKIDPFWIILERARNGDNLAKLQLRDELHHALDRQTIDPLKNPMEYMYIRDEILSMYEQLAEAGVGIAAHTLYTEHLAERKAAVLPRNLLMAYYYGLLSTKIGFAGGNPGEDALRREILSKMSEAELEKAEAIRQKIKDRW